MGLDVRKPEVGACEQQRRRPVHVSTQSDQRLYYLVVFPDQTHLLFYIIFFFLTKIYVVGIQKNPLSEMVLFDHLKYNLE